MFSKIYKQIAFSKKKKSFSFVFRVFFFFLIGNLVFRDFFVLFGRMTFKELGIKKCRTIYSFSIRIKMLWFYD